MPPAAVSVTEKVFPIVDANSGTFSYDAGMVRGQGSVARALPWPP
jgi:hypothetical protein